MPNIEDTLREIDAWYNELPGGTKRPTYLSRLAILELCGWLEIRFDELMLMVGTRCGLDPSWIEGNITQKNYGFTYTDHVRLMLVKMIGEVGVKKIEVTLEAASPSTLDQMRSELGSLWKIRGHIAHANTGVPIPKQIVINAPSWSINRQRILAKAIDLLDMHLRGTL